MRVDVLHDGLVSAYNGYLLTFEGSLLYYSAKYKDFILALLGCKEQYLVVRKDGNINGVMPLMYMEHEGRRVYNSLPYYGSHGGILTHSKDAATALANTYNELVLSSNTAASTVVINPFEPCQIQHIVFTHTDYRIGQFTPLSAADQDEQVFLARVESSTRRNVKKAKVNGITISIDNTQIESLQKMHQDGIREIGGIPKTNDFFELVPRYFVAGRDYDIYAAQHEGRIIAALMVFFFNRTVEYFTPAVEFQSRSLQPLSLILVKAISDAARRGFTRWNWGGTWKSQVGVYRFKKKWAAAELPYKYLVQLNDKELLNWSKRAFGLSFPNFYVIPFSALKEENL